MRSYSSGGGSVNLLPLLMTLINVVSAAIYMKGFPLKSKVQMYGIAAIFLVLLYNSPAGLVFYWTLNNVFSLVKNVFYKLKNPKRAICIVLSAAGLALLVIVLFVHPLSSMKRQALGIACCLLLQFPLVWRFARARLPRRPRISLPEPNDVAFLLGCLVLALLTGLLIPTTTIAASPQEFIDTTTLQSPLHNVLYSLALALGTFVIWFGVFYRLATANGKSVMCAFVWVFCIAAVIDYMFFGTGYGNLSPLLQYDSKLHIHRVDMLRNAAVLLVATAALLVVWATRQSVTRFAYAVMGLAMIGMSAMNVGSIVPEVDAGLAVLSSADGAVSIPLSKEGKNVVVLMMDRACSQLLPVLMEEKPQLQEQFAGFTYYPNTISYGSTTNIGAPALYGGYEYTPEKMNERADVSLADKMGESLKVMPVLFDRNGYDVTVCDPTYAGYQWIPDLSIFDEYPNIRKFITMDGSFQVEGFPTATYEEVLSRNLFCYSIFKISPVAAHRALYNQGNYNDLNLPGAARAATKAHVSSKEQTMHGKSRATGVRTDFLRSYAVLESLPAITEITDSSTGTFLMMSNDTAHSPMILQEPDYRVSWNVDNRDYDEAHDVRDGIDGSSLQLETVKQMKHYHVNMAAFLKLGEWFDYLRENGVYDNTRIIIVSDHGYNLSLRKSLIMPVLDKEFEGKKAKWDLEIFNCMLMVKDFGSDEFKIDDTFMTNADTPSLALDGLVDDPINPLTGNAIEASKKDEPVQHVQWTRDWDIRENHGNTFQPGRWFAVKTDDIFNLDSWEYLGVY